VILAATDEDRPAIVVNHARALGSPPLQADPTDLVSASLAPQEVGLAVLGHELLDGLVDSLGCRFHWLFPVVPLALLALFALMRIALGAQSVILLFEPTDILSIRLESAPTCGNA
jgi:hypothetical protein